MSLKELTAEAHRQAETQPFVKLIFSGNITKEEYATYLYNQYAAYEILESHALIVGLLNDLPGIQRAAKLLEDFKELWPADQTVPALANNNHFIFMPLYCINRIYQNRRRFYLI